jgi:hypothetical protein
MKHIQLTSRELPAKAQFCEDVSLFTPNKGLDEYECLLGELREVAHGLYVLKLAV